MEGKLPSCLFIYKITTCVSINPTVLNCTANWGQERQGWSVTEKVTRFFSDFFHSTSVCWAASLMACATCKGTENRSLFPRSLLYLWRKRNSHNYSSSRRPDQGFVKPELQFDFLCLICFLISSLSRCWSLTNILEAKLFQHQLRKDPPGDIQQGGKHGILVTRLYPLVAESMRRKGHKALLLVDTSKIVDWLSQLPTPSTVVRIKKL